MREKPEKSNYIWANDNNWHYFKCEQIKWRVLETSGTEVFSDDNRIKGYMLPEAETPYLVISQNNRYENGDYTSVSPAALFVYRDDGKTWTALESQQETAENQNIQVTGIAQKAFNKCKNLKKITIKTTKLTKKSVGKQAFKGIHKKATIKVPKAKQKAYKKILKARGAGKKVKIK